MGYAEWKWPVVEHERKNNESEEKEIEQGAW
jgi:hypothetical protein